MSYQTARFRDRRVEHAGGRVPAIHGKVHRRSGGGHLAGVAREELLHGLEGADGTSELLAGLGVLDRELERGLHGPRELGSAL